MSVLVVVLTGLALLTTGVLLVTARSWRTALGMLAEMLTAAGLIRLSATGSWVALGSAALIIVVRVVLLRTLRADLSWSGADRRAERSDDHPYVCLE